MKLLKVALLFGTLVTLIGCGSSSSRTLVGEWEETNFPDRTRSFVMKADGTYEESIQYKQSQVSANLKGTYKLANDELKLTVESGSRNLGGKTEQRRANATTYGGKLEWLSNDEVKITVQPGIFMVWKRKKA